MVRTQMVQNLPEIYNSFKDYRHFRFPAKFKRVAALYQGFITPKRAKICSKSLYL